MGSIFGHFLVLTAAAGYLASRWRPVGFFGGNGRLAALGRCVLTAGPAALQQVFKKGLGWDRQKLCSQVNHTPLGRQREALDIEDGQPVAFRQPAERLS